MRTETMEIIDLVWLDGYNVREGPPQDPTHRPMFLICVHNRVFGPNLEIRQYDDYMVTDGEFTWLRCHRRANTSTVEGCLYLDPEIRRQIQQLIGEWLNVGVRGNTQIYQ